MEIFSYGIDLLLTPKEHQLDLGCNVHVISKLCWKDQSPVWPTVVVLLTLPELPDLMCSRAVPKFLSVPSSLSIEEGRNSKG